MPGTRKLGRPTDQRMAMLRGMVTYLFENGRIETTLTRAKEVSALADKMITLGKKNTLASYRQALAFITKEDVAHNLFSVTAPSTPNAPADIPAFTSSAPRGDGAEMALIEFVETDKELEKPAKKAPAKKSGAAAKKAPAKKAAPKAEEAAAPEQAEAAAAEAVAAEVVAAAEETVAAEPAAAEETAAAEEKSGIT